MFHFVTTFASQTTKEMKYKIEFTEITAFGNKKMSTKWMASIEECKNSKWINCIDAKIVSATIVKEPFKKIA